MYQIKECPCCGTPSEEGRWALISPFIARYVLKEPVFSCRLMECPRCAMRYFDGRLNEQETQFLYSEYRGATYFKVRHEAEFWYTKALNEGIGSDPRLLGGRKTRMASFLAPHLRCNPESLEHILDYGGDSGQLIPSHFGKNRWVYEVSEATPVDRVVKISDPALLVSNGYDLILLCHVLEHCSSPLDLIRYLSDLLRPDGLLYIEVPLEHFSVTFAGKSDAYRRWLTWLARHPRILNWMDFYSSANRVALGWIPPLGFAKLHEHLNFFTLQALQELLTRCGLQWVAGSVERLAPGVDPTPVLACVARRSRNPFEKVKN